MSLRGRPFCFPSPLYLHHQEKTKGVIFLFEATMDATPSDGPFVGEETGTEYRLTFTTTQAADRGVYPHLNEEQVHEMRESMNQRGILILTLMTLTLRTGVTFENKKRIY